jgi:hypothetical protein
MPLPICGCNCENCTKRITNFIDRGSDIVAESKKVLVAFDPEKPDKQSSDFLVPIPTEGGGVALLGSKSGKVAAYGLVVMTGKSVNENDLFAKLVDTGQKVPSVDECLARLSAYIEQVKSVRIGNIVELESSDGGMKLNVAANTPSGFSKT